MSFLIEILAEILGVDEVPIHTQRDSEWSIDVQWLRFRPRAEYQNQKH